MRADHRDISRHEPMPIGWMVARRSAAGGPLSLELSLRLALPFHGCHAPQRERHLIRSSHQLAVMKKEKEKRHGGCIWGSSAEWKPPPTEISGKDIARGKESSDFVCILLFGEIVCPIGCVFEPADENGESMRWRHGHFVADPMDSGAICRTVAANSSSDCRSLLLLAAA